MDTKEFHELTPEEYKQQTQANWSSDPCGSNYSDKEFMSREFFEEVEKHRYRTHPWILEAIKKFNIRNKKVLEIGFGMGTDHLSLAKQGGIMHGLDLTPRNSEVTSRRFNLYGEKSEFTIGDAEYLPYKDHSFDFVYSFGVIHHSPDTQKIINEIHRILKPGGKCWVSVYHKNSVVFWWSLFLYNWILKGGFLRETLKQRISRMEYPQNNPNLVIKLYKRKEFEQMFSMFGNTISSVRHLLRDDISLFGSFIPERQIAKLGKKFGWYVIVDAIK